MENGPLKEVRRCRAHSSRTGLPCRKTPIAGGVVCRSHGGAAPQVREAAAARLVALQSPAVNALEEALQSEQRTLDRRGNVQTLGPDTAGRTRAAIAILDRTGLGPSSTTNVSVEAGERLAQLMSLLDDPDYQASTDIVAETPLSPHEFLQTRALNAQNPSRHGREDAPDHAQAKP